MAMRTPLKNVRHLGSAKEGADHFWKQRVTGVANLAALLPMLDETSFLAKFLGMIDLFLIWWVVVLAIGLAALYKKQTSSVATGLFIFYGVIALAIAYFTAG